MSGEVSYEEILEEFRENIASIKDTAELRVYPEPPKDPGSSES
jgi:hypothetical protein